MEVYHDALCNLSIAIYYLLIFISKRLLDYVNNCINDLILVLSTKFKGILEIAYVTGTKMDINQAYDVPYIL